MPGAGSQIPGPSPNYHPCGELRMFIMDIQAHPCSDYKLSWLDRKQLRKEDVWLLLDATKRLWGTAIVVW